MRLQLKDFQSDAVERLVAQLRLAAREATVTEQAVVLSSPTGSGKTIIATAAIERILEGDEQQAPEREARFLWLSDQPELNEQTLRKMRETSSTLSAARLTLIDSTFDQECLAAGRVYFLNTQKLGRDRQLVTRGDIRKYTIWETLQNTATRFPQSFFVFLDEAHRGMTNAREQREAATLVQKFIKGSPEEMAPVPIIVGISATPERFDRLIQQTPRTRRLVSIPVEAVRASGLLKDVVRLYHPIGRGPTDLTMLREAAEACRRYTEHWERYCSAHNEPTVRPVLVVQVQDGSARQISATDLGAAVGVIDEALGPLPTEAYAHAFQDGAAISVGGHDLRYLAPSEITGDPDVRVVFFKTSLNTGWDCPRAEVMMSFRKAVDATLIAQLVGRMVRTPLARRIGADEFLNMVSLYLPHYDQAGLDSVVEYLRGGDPDFVPPVDVEDGNSILTASRAEESAELFAALSELPSYVIPRRRRVSGVRRLMKLARLLVHDEIDENAVDTAQELLLDVLRAEFKALAGSEVFDTILREKGRVRIGAVVRAQAPRPAAPAGGHPRPFSAGGSRRGRALAVGAVRVVPARVPPPDARRVDGAGSARPMLLAALQPAGEGRRGRTRRKQEEAEGEARVAPGDGGLPGAPRRDREGGGVSVGRVLAVAAAAGFAGWAIENAIDGPRFSQAFGPGNKVPWLPVYAAGGAVLALLAPRVQKEPWLLRVAAYGAVLTGLEAIVGVAERHDGGPVSWGYGADDAPVDLRHAAAWTLLAALAEPAVLAATRAP